MSSRSLRTRARCTAGGASSESCETETLIGCIVTAIVVLIASYAVFYPCGKRAGAAQAQARSSGSGAVPVGQVETAIANAKRSVSPGSRNAYSNQIDTNV